MQTSQSPEITVTIQSGRGSASFTFPQQTKVADVIEVARVKFGYPAGDSYTLIRNTDKATLEPQRPLVSYHIENGEVLTLSATGSGVWQSTRTFLAGSSKLN